MFSIIIPVYNIEKYIEECVTSVLNQTWQDWELILVDDGSVDNSANVCDRLAESDGRIKVIHKKNEGLSEARNTGIYNSQGDYILFLDGDDYWNNADGLEKINEIINKTNSDIIQFFSAKQFPDGKRVPSNKLYNGDVVSYSEQLKYMIEKDLYSGAAWDKAYKSSLLKSNDLRFKRGIKSEDVEFNFRLMQYSPSIAFYNKDFYIYRQGRPGSITNTVDVNHCAQLLQTIESFINQKMNDLDKDVLLNYVAFQYCVLLANVFTLPNSDKSELLKKAKSLKYLFKYSLNPRVKKISMLYKILGFYFTGIMLSLYIKNR